MNVSPRSAKDSAPLSSGWSGQRGWSQSGLGTAHHVGARWGRCATGPDRTAPLPPTHRLASRLTSRRLASAASRPRCLRSSGYILAAGKGGVRPAWGRRRSAAWEAELEHAHPANWPREGNRRRRRGGVPASSDGNLAQPIAGCFGNTRPLRPLLLHPCAGHGLSHVEALRMSSHGLLGSGVPGMGTC